MAKQVWVIRAGVGNVLAEDIAKKNAVAIGWEEVPDLKKFKTRDEVKRAYLAIYPEDGAVRAGIQTGQLWRFSTEIKSGDFILTPIQKTREVWIGEAVGTYEFNQALFKGYPHTRGVNWNKKISRDQMSMPFRNAVGGTLTVFSVSDHLAEVQALLHGTADSIPAESEVLSIPEVSLYEDTKAKAEALISDLIDRLDPYEFQDLVAGVLEAMGFRARSSPPGRDGGIDIVAHRDALGLEGTLIKVQVKHRKGDATGPEIQQFNGALKTSDYGLFVSTGGFTKDAIRMGGSTEKKFRLLDREEFVELLLENYEKMAPLYQALVPLKKVYIPVK